MPKRSDFHAFLDEDVGRGDITSELVVPRGTQAEAVILAKEACTVAGLDEAHTLFEELRVDFEALVEDGASVTAGTTVARLSGKARSILKGERVALNIIQRMSGIATLTARMLAKGRARNPRLVLAATRKTTPGFRAFEKRAVALGGGAPHRFALDDMVLVKDNHIALAGSVKEAMARLGARQGDAFTRRVEVEASNLPEALLAAAMGADIVMLDNFDVAHLRAAYKEIKRLYPRVLVEVSGGINEGNIAKVAPFADIVSSGALTHSARAADFSLEIVAKKARAPAPSSRKKGTGGKRQ